MANALPDRNLAPDPAAQPASVSADTRGTARLKEVPPAALRAAIRDRTASLAQQLDKTRPLVRHELERHSRAVLAELALPESYLGWTMVVVASAFWTEQVAAVPYERRLLLLPHCMRNATSCPASYNTLGLLCQECGACELCGLKTHAQALGYKVMIAEGSPTVMKIILGGRVDALVGVACLDALERTLDKILLAGIPCMAVPLVRGGCRETEGEAEWIRRMIDTPYRPAPLRTRTYLHLLRAAARMFEPSELERLAPRRRGSLQQAAGNGEGLDALDAVACTEAIAYDFLAAGGKHSRPFITLAVYDAVTGGRGTLPDGAEHAAQFPDAVRRVALAIEVFHKASLVHDDVEDNDAFRYGRPTLHQKYGLATAINVGDFLIGLGYRLVAEQSAALGTDTVAEILALLAQAHTRLCEGQGAELVWRDARHKRFTPADALRIYALKTAPAFEVAITTGLRMAGPVEPFRDAVSRFARHLGVAYQMLNDLDDWQAGQAEESGPAKQAEPFAERIEEQKAEQNSVRQRGSDLLGGRPTMLWALALERLSETERCELESLLTAPLPPQQRIRRADEIYARADVYQRAAALTARHHQRACAAAETITCEPLRHLLVFLADAILDRRPLAVSEEKTE